MCLQRDSVNHIYGFANFASKVAIKINNKIYYGYVDENYCFHVYLPMFNAGGPYKMEIITDVGRKIINDVYIGEVYLCAGQSNMEMTLSQCGEIMANYYNNSNVNNDKIRLLKMDYNPQYTPTASFKGNINWVGANQYSVKSFSAVAYVFGKQLQEKLDCPVGLILSCKSGSILEHWLSEKTYEDICKIYNPVTNTSTNQLTPCLGYNGMFYPLKGYTMRGAIWYQGCANAYGTENYYLFGLQALVNQCREDFNNENFTFTVCQLARYQENPLAYSIINENINSLAKIEEKIAVARNLDLGEWYDIHPKEKSTLAIRAANETLRLFYNENIKAPIYIESYAFNEDNSVTIVLSEDVILKNNANGFEIFDGKSFRTDMQVSSHKNIITIKTTYPIRSIRYGYVCKMTDEIIQDVSKMVSVYDNSGMPLDLFQITK